MSGELSLPSRSPGDPQSTYRADHHTKDRGSPHARRACASGSGSSAPLSVARSRLLSLTHGARGHRSRCGSDPARKHGGGEVTVRRVGAGVGASVVAEAEAGPGAGAGAGRARTGVPPSGLKTSAWAAASQTVCRRVCCSGRGMRSSWLSAGCSGQTRLRRTRPPLGQTPVPSCSRHTLLFVRFCWLRTLVRLVPAPGGIHRGVRVATIVPVRGPPHMHTLKASAVAGVQDACDLHHRLTVTNAIAAAWVRDPGIRLAKSSAHTHGDLPGKGSRQLHGLVMPVRRARPFCIL